MGSRWRRWVSSLCLALAGILLPVGVVAAWADAVFFDSRTFAERSVQLLDSPAMRRELAERITEQLALAGNRQAINFGPAFQLAIEGAANTDAFRSVFRSAVVRAHQQVLRGGSDGSLDLSDSVSIIANTIQLAQGSGTGAADERSLDATLTDVTQRITDINIWRWEKITRTVLWGGLVGAVVFALAGIALAADHRRAVRRMGWIVVADGLVISALVVGGVWYSGRLVSDSQLSQGIQDGVSEWTQDLRTIGLWLAGYGVVMAAAAVAGVRRITPESTATRVANWVEKQRATAASRLGLSVLFVVAGAMLVASPWFWLRVAILGLGLWLIYFGVTEVLLLVRSRTPDATIVDEQRKRRPLTSRLALSGVAILAVLAVMSVGLFTTTSRAAKQASAVGAPDCNGDESLCDLPINRIVFPGTHNSMSSALNPGWLFAEHVRTIASQLESGVRALLIDTHYGLPSSSRLPGSETPLILTDVAAGLSRPSVEQSDPATAARAAELAAKSPPSAGAIRDIYLCHNYCELGAIKFSDVLADIKAFLDTNPDEILMTVIQDATTPADTAEAFIRAGVEDRIYTLQPDRPLPTLRDMIESGRTLLVFAEEGGPGAPPWYQPAYERWFQETPFAWTAPAEMNCSSNRGTPTGPFLMVNHWVSASPPNPANASTVNKRPFLTDRLRRCVNERAALPNVVAVDFSEQGDLIDTVADMNDQLREQLREARGRPRPSTSAVPGATTTVPASSTTVPGQVAAASPLPLPTPTVVTQLTGGDPAGFCAQRDATRSIVSAWALAQVVAPPGGRGLSDLAFGPAAARAFERIGPSLPAELVATSAPTRDRARAAVQALTDLGLDARAITDLADMAESRLTGADYPDPVAVQTALIDRERALVGAARLDAAAAAFTAAQPDVPGLFDLGQVPDDVARGRGFTCLLPEGG